MKKLCFFLAPFLFFAFTQTSESQVNTNQEKLVKSDSVKSDLAKAQSLVMQGNAIDASKIYVRIIESQPDNKEAVQGWLMTNMKREPGGEEEAITQLEELSKSYPNNTGIIFFKAFLNAENNHNEEALKDIEKLIKVQPDTALHYILKGQVLSSMQKYNEAANALVAANKSLEIAPNNPNGVYNRACIYCLKGDKTNALADLKKAISMNPSFKEYARQDEDFKELYDDEDFKKITL